MIEKLRGARISADYRAAMELAEECTLAEQRELIEHFLNARKRLVMGVR